MIRIGIDAMGGDNAPKEIVKGAILATKLNKELSLTLVGDEEKINWALEITEMKQLEDEKVSSLSGRKGGQKPH